MKTATRPFVVKPMSTQEFRFRRTWRGRWILQRWDRRANIGHGPGDWYGGWVDCSLEDVMEFQQHATRPLPAEHTPKEES